MNSTENIIQSSLNNFSTSAEVRPQEILIDTLNRLILDCNLYLKMYQSGQYSLCKGILGQFCEKYIIFIEMILETHRLEMNNAEQSFFTKRDLQNMLSVFKALKTSIKNTQQNHTADLIEHELKDNLKQWKIALTQRTTFHF